MSEPSTFEDGEVTRSRSAFGTEEPIKRTEVREDRCATGAGEITRVVHWEKRLPKNFKRIVRLEEENVI